MLIPVRKNLLSDEFYLFDLSIDRKDTMGKYAIQQKKYIKGYMLYIQYNKRNTENNRYRMSDTSMIDRIYLTHRKLAKQQLKNLLQRSPFIPGAIVYMNLSNNKIGMRGVKLLADCGRFEGLTTLWLCFNMIGSDAIKYLGAFSKLKSLYLRNNKISSRGASHISSQQLKHLSLLELSGNEIEVEGIIILLNANFGKLTISLYDNGISKKDRNQLRKMLKKRSDLYFVL